MLNYLYSKINIDDGTNERILLYRVPDFFEEVKVEIKNKQRNSLNITTSCVQLHTCVV